MSPHITARVKAAARAIGFDAAGVCDLRPIERQTLAQWLTRGYAGGMRYMRSQAIRRREPQRIAPQCARVVVVLKNYYQRDGTAPLAPAGETPAATVQKSPVEAGATILPKSAVEVGVSRAGAAGAVPTVRDSSQPAARVARYAWGEDYHRVVGDQLARLAAVLVELGASAEQTRWFVDAGPVPERELAERAGLGWIGKNTMLIRPEVGSFTFIGTVFTDLALPVDEPFVTDHCGSCRLCLDACPTAAFAEERLLDARRCISYLTIEHRGVFEACAGAQIGAWLFGCDVCQDVCPWNEKFARPTREPRFAPRPAVVGPALDELARLDESGFAERYSDTAFARAGANGIARNARQVLSNQSAPLRSGSPSLPRRGNRSLTER